jgi:hypothetical protein
MPNTQKMKKSNLEKIIMEKVTKNEIIMKPRWYFVVGSALLMVGFVSFSIVAVFSLNLILFLLKEHGPMGEWRLQMILESFPLWAPLLAGIGIGLGIYALKQYDFSYKKNFTLVILGFIASIIVAAFILDYTGLSTVWFTQGPMRQFYKQIESPNSPPQRGQGQRLKYTN